MTCPLCNGKTMIWDSRHDDESVRRGRKCLECGYKFLTIEIDKDLYDRLEKRNGLSNVGVREAIDEAVVQIKNELYKSFELKGEI